MKVIKIFFIISFLFIISISIFAGGETGFDILQLNLGGRAISLGEAYTALGDNVESINYNPAGIFYITKKEIEYMYWTSFAGVQIHYAGYAQPIESIFLEGKVGLSFIYRTIPTINNEDAVDEPVKYYDYVLSGSYSNDLYYFIKNDFLKDIAFGITVKIISQQIREYKISGFAIDSGFIYKPENSNLKLGVSILNIGPSVKIIKENSLLPLTIRLGSSYAIKIDENNKLNLSMDYIQDIYNYGKIAFGIEENLLNLLFFRAGYNSFLDSFSPQTISFGVGLKITQFDVDVILNYSLKPFLWENFDIMNLTHVLSLMIKIP